MIDSYTYGTVEVVVDTEAAERAFLDLIEVALGTFSVPTTYQNNTDPYSLLEDDPDDLDNVKGSVFGKLTAIKLAEKSNTKWNCRCECGSSLVAYLSALRKGHIKSCGCLPRSKPIRRTDSTKKAVLI